MFHTLICSEELNKDLLVKEKLQTWEETGLQLVLLPADAPFEILKALDCEEALWIVLTEEEYEFAKAQGIPCVPYVGDEQYDRFPKATHLLAGDGLEGIYYVELSYLEKLYQREKGIPWTIAQTDRFILREFSMDDMDALFELYEDETLYPFVEPLFERSAEEEYQRKYIANMYHLLGYGMWLIIEPTTGKLIGRAGLENHDYGDESGLELGYLVLREYRRKGLAKEVCQHIIKFAEEELEYKQLNCVIHVENEASIAFAKSLGFSFLEERIENGKKMHRYVLGDGG